MTERKWPDNQIEKGEVKTWPPVDLESAEGALRQIQAIVHQRTAKTEPALHHFQRDFDAIRDICAGIVGQYDRYRQ